VKGNSKQTGCCSRLIEGKGKKVDSESVKVATITYVIKITQTQIRKVCPIEPEDIHLPFCTWVVVSMFFSLSGCSILVVFSTQTNLKSAN